MKGEACRAFYYFCNEFNQFNNAGARMLDYIYHNYYIKIILKSYFA